MNNTESMKHTHRGTCQACGRPTAMQLRNDKLAKHGYTVEWGFFSGICFGSEAAPLELDKTITLKVISDLTDRAIEADKLAADLKNGAVEPEFYNSSYDRIKCKTVRTACKREELKFQCYETQDAVAERQIAAAIMRAESDARHMRSHVSMLQKLIVERHGKPLMPVSAKKELTVGARVLLGGKKGSICEVIEIKDQVASGCGPYLNGKHMLHAILKSPKGRIVAVPVRMIRQAAIIEGGAQ